MVMEKLVKGACGVLKCVQLGLREFEFGVDLKAAGIMEMIEFDK